ncbi:MAG: hypothetical protein V2I43_11625, partial [Parvularcula sp.]|nr:hypothetical protein [Parvularcula sp.]
MVSRLLLVALTVCSAFTLHTGAEAQSAVRPQDDFYSYVNEAWLAETGIPDDVPWISPFVVNTLEVQSEVRAVIEEASRREH